MPDVQPRVTLAQPLTQVVAPNTPKGWPKAGTKKTGKQTCMHTANRVELCTLCEAAAGREGICTHGLGSPRGGTILVVSGLK